MTITKYRTGAGLRTRAGGRSCEDIDSVDTGSNGIAASCMLAALVLAVCFCLSSALGAQRPGARDGEKPVLKSDERVERTGSPGFVNGGETTPQRHTPLGIQVPTERDLPKQSREVAVITDSNTLQRMGISSELPGQSRSEMIAGGTVTVYASSGPIAFGVTLVQDGEHGSQSVLLRQPDGKLWDGRADHLVPGAGPALEFLETQYRRGLQQLMKSSERDSTITDGETRDGFRTVTVQEENGESTKYSLDPATSRMARFEFDRRQSQDSAGNAVPVVHDYSFSDVRDADGVATPFHIEHFVNSEKQEELRLTKVRYNSAANRVPADRPAGR